MSQAKRKRRRKAVPVLGAAGLSLSLGGGAPAATGVTTADIPTCSVAVNHEQMLREEEITDITLSTFHIFDREEYASAACANRRMRRLRRLRIRLVF